MGITKFVDSRKVEAFDDCYINYQVLKDSLSNIRRLEYEKAYSLDFTILHPHETEDGKYRVLPVVSNEEFMDQYRGFLSLLQCELERLDGVISSHISSYSAIVTKAKLELLMPQSKTWMSQLTRWATFRSSQKPQISDKLFDVENKLSIIRKNVIPLNKFALAKILELKEKMVQESRYRHLLLQVEFGVEIPAAPSPFPIKGKLNHHHFIPRHPPTIAITAPPDSEETPWANQTLLPKESKFRLNANLKLVIPDQPYSTTSFSSCSSTPSSNISPKSYSSSISNASTSSSYSREEIVRKVQFWSNTPSSVGTLLGEVKALRRHNTTNNIKHRLLDEMP
ncbi:hypothetical protein DSO57_1012504 [Entomophthora muscae]|uniref:Uncharacterized protein n=1 Tax=Entomophthora muscae TaxID=34485 RepID=A0ACC2T5W1_9FUNG|nr:hypothetical protein DSO57_1012504 [Entomophthora muscae]